MTVSDKTLSRLTTLTTLGMAGGLAGAIYFGRTTPIESSLLNIQNEKAKVTAELVDCVPRDRKNSISDMCINYAKQYDSLNQQAQRIEQMPAYISARKDKLYSYGFGMLLGLSYFGSSYLSKKREDEEAL